MKLLACLAVVVCVCLAECVVMSPILLRARLTDDPMIAVLWLVGCLAWALVGGMACEDVYRRAAR